jgi:hypothetical protein
MEQYPVSAVINGLFDMKAWVVVVVTRTARYEVIVAFLYTF